MTLRTSSEGLIARGIEISSLYKIPHKQSCSPLQLIYILVSYCVVVFVLRMPMFCR